MKEKCIFCLISNKKSPAEILIEEKSNFALLDIKPLSPGHSLVVTKKHYSNLFDINQEDWNNLLSTIKKLKEKINNNYSPKGFNLIVNIGREAYQSIDHLHIHIIPKYEKEKGFVWPEENY